MKFLKHTIYLAIIVFGLSVAQSTFAAVTIGNLSIQSYPDGQVIFAQVNVTIDKGQTVQIVDIESIYNNSNGKRIANVYKIKTSDISAKKTRSEFFKYKDGVFGVGDTDFENEEISIGDPETKSQYSLFVLASDLNLAPTSADKAYRLYIADDKTGTKSPIIQIQVDQNKKLSVYNPGVQTVSKPAITTQVVTTTKGVTTAAITAQQEVPQEKTGEVPQKPNEVPQDNSKTGNNNVSVIKLKNPLKPGLDTIPKIINAILDGIVIPIAVPIFILAIIWTGILYVIARGKPTEITKAHEALKWTIIGGAVILGAKLISTAIAGTLAAITNTVVK
jgi:hypothetical protein